LKDAIDKKDEITNVKDKLDEQL